jgi:hypothetical protein
MQQEDNANGQVITATKTTVSREQGLLFGKLPGQGFQEASLVRRTAVLLEERKLWPVNSYREDGCFKNMASSIIIHVLSLSLLPQGLAM